MIGMVLVTHGDLAKEFVSALQHVVGEQENIAAVCIGPDDDMEQRRADILASVEAVDDGKGVVLLTDMFGGTPSNLAISIMEQANVEVIAGVNLPLLIKLASVRIDGSLAETVNAAQEAGRKYINVASRLLSGEE
ncbi:PTS sugar transporter subunit IIA [Thalassospira alkalitolerans]|uniref:PTS fructose transporter subunit IIA n=1 Tax=Thalassospira alkalitolerans TaxID=1293890 RepID=A0A1Y2LGR1_9PROT|nr:PTS sugar transporter subunit IIA [Thalassospira alkalitolerans]OSQ50351.1 PTS fructose transporter subunit IIA [Thalassospira alkalitolerans]|tara:strand:+ start:9326 stop:9730 length:405 start_codon:yes stop_codon:yes gene_type:complete